jgi:hypothetical protein
VTSAQAVHAALADAIRKQAVQSGEQTPNVRGADWRQAIVATVGTDGTVITTDGVTARRLDSYQNPLTGDRIILSVSGSGNWLACGRTAAAVDGVGAALFASKPSSTDRSSTTTLTDDPHLTVTVTAGAVYKLTMYLTWTGGTTGAFKAAFNAPSGTTGRWSLYGPDLSIVSGATTSGVRLSSSSSLTTGQLAGSSSTSVPVTALPTGLITAGASGAFTFQWAQNGSDATVTSLLPGSWMELKRVA